MADYFFKIFTSLRNCNVACSPALRLGGASEQLSGLCLQKVHSPLFKLECNTSMRFPSVRESHVPRTVLWKMEIGEGRGRTSISTSKWRRESTWWVEIDKKSQSIGSEALRRHTMCSNSNRMQSCRRVVQQQNMSL